MDAASGCPWDAAGTVAGFAQAAPNAVLMQFAAIELARFRNARLLDIGCGAARNAIPLAQLGWNVLGIDLSWPMLEAAAGRARQTTTGGRLQLAVAAMDRLPVKDDSVDFVVAHGIWNLAPSAALFRHALAEAARVARAGAALFAFTFSRHTLDPHVRPVPGEPFVFTEFSGQPQCFLTEAELVAELDTVGFHPERGVPIKEYNYPRPPQLIRTSMPAIHEGIFRKRA